MQIFCSVEMICVLYKRGTAFCCSVPGICSGRWCCTTFIFSRRVEYYNARPRMLDDDQYRLELLLSCLKKHNNEAVFLGRNRMLVEVYCLRAHCISRCANT